MYLLYLYHVGEKVQKYDVQTLKIEKGKRSLKPTPTFFGGDPVGTFSIDRIGSGFYLNFITYFFYLLKNTFNKHKKGDLKSLKIILEVQIFS